MANINNIAAMFKALGDPTRLKIFQFLRSCQKSVAVDESGDIRQVSCNNGELPNVGDVCCHITGIEKVTSVISFHLKELRLAGLINMERQGKNMICEVNASAIETLHEYLLDDTMKPKETAGNNNESSIKQICDSCVENIESEGKPDTA